MSSLVDRFKDALVAIIEELIPNRKFMVPIRYRVSKAGGGKFSATPERKADGFPPISDAPIRGIPGGNAASKLKAGTSILVVFANGDPGDPFLGWIDESVSPDELALEGVTKIKADAPQVLLNGGVLGVARMTDTVIAGPFPGVITSASATVKAG